MSSSSSSSSSSNTYHQQQHQQQHVYEQLGAPSLLYRHAPSYHQSYADTTTLPAAPWRLDWYPAREARYQCLAHNRQTRTRARWYYPVMGNHHVWNEEKQDEREEEELSAVVVVNTKKKRRRKTKTKRRRGKLDAASRDDNDDDSNRDSDQDDKSDDDTANNDMFSASSAASAAVVVTKQEATRAICQGLNQMDPLLDREFLNDNRLSAHMQQAMSRSNQPIAVKRSYQQYDHAYIPGSYRGGNPAYYLSPILTKNRWKNSLDMSIARRNADVAYLAPFDFNSLNESLGNDKETKSREEKKLFRTKTRQQTFPIQADDMYSPKRYGNCLVCLECPCVYCRGQNNRDERSYCLIHPVGDLLSTVCISNLHFPHGPQNSAPTKESNPRFLTRAYERHEHDVGDPILQIEHCTSEPHRPDSLGLFLIRTTCHVTVLRIESYLYAGSKDKGSVPSKRKKVNKGDLECCIGTYHMEQVTRIDLRSLTRTLPSYYPIDVAGHPKYGNAFSNAKFAVLSRADRDTCANTIHHVMLREEPAVEEHKITCLQNISTISFAFTNPMTLWAAATSYVRPALVSDIYSKRPPLSHGASLYTIDLRSNDATFQWSPSAEEFMVEGTHAVSGIMTDWHKPHAVFVSSASAGKTYELDGRMMARVVNSWSLPFTCDDSGALLPAMGLHGAGMLLVDPLAGDDVCRPILAVDKSPGSFGLHLYQRPEVRPIFQTKSLECVSGALPAGRGASIACSNVYALPDVSERVFTCGLAAFDVPVSHLVKKEDLGGADRILGAVTMTNKGDLYTHLLLRGGLDEPRRSKLFSGLPVGATAVPIPSVEQPRDPKSSPFRYRRMRKLDGGWNLPVVVSHQYPIASTNVNNATITSKAAVRPFESVELDRLAKRAPEKTDKKIPDQTTAPDAYEEYLAPEYSDAARQSLMAFHNGFGQQQTQTALRTHRHSDLDITTLNTVEYLWEDEDDPGRV